MKKGLLFLLAAVLALLVFRPRPQPAPAPQAPEPASTPRPAATPPASSAPVPPSFPALRPPDPRNLQPVPPHPDAESFGTSAFTPEQEPALLLGFFQLYRERFGSFPGGENNAQLMNALRGNNPRNLGIFPLQHPRLDDEGNLLDAWGTPFFFHLLSSQELEIRSAGPDRELYSSDDVSFPPSRHGARRKVELRY